MPNELSAISNKHAKLINHIDKAIERLRRNFHFTVIACNVFFLHFGDSVWRQFLSLLPNYGASI